MERDLYKQINLAKTLEFKHDTVKKQRNFKAAANLFNFLSLKKKKERKAAVKL